MLAPIPLLAAQALVIAQNGHSNWVIVANDPRPAIARGAGELQTFIKQITGATLPIEKVSEPGVKTVRVEYDYADAEEEYTIRTGRGGITIAGGGNRGALYGCYGFLQDVLGCRWFTPKITRIPHEPTLVIGPLDIHEKPAFEYREPYFEEAWDKDWDARNRLNGNAMPLDDSTGGKVSYGRFVHTFAELVPPEKYFKDHPEYFSLVNGKRQSGYAQLCLTNPDVLKIVVAKVKEWIRENPQATIFSVSQNDTYLNCQCDNCKKVEQEEGAPSGPLIRFVNQVADEVGKEYPRVLIDTLAYQWSEKPPLHEKLRKNVRIRLAPIGACFAHPLDGCKKNEAPYANLKAWSAITNQIYVWHYCTDFANYLQPLPDLDEIARDVKIFHDHGVVGLFYEGDGAPGGGGDMAELKDYLMARLMWNPDLPAKPIIQEFLNGVYGKAAPEIGAWLDLTEDAARTKGVDATIYDPPTAPYFTDAMLAEGDRLFDTAEANVSNEPMTLDEVQRARLGLEYVELMRMAAGDPRRAALLKTVADKIHRYGIKQTSEGGSAEELLKKLGA